jgi:hypothetical protein
MKVLDRVLGWGRRGSCAVAERRDACRGVGHPSVLHNLFNLFEEPPELLMTVWGQACLLGPTGNDFEGRPKAWRRYSDVVTGRALGTLGKIGAVQSRVWNCNFSSMLRSTAISGGAQMQPDEQHTGHEEW